jgi:hypothetical protein
MDLDESYKLYDSLMDVCGNKIKINVIGKPIVFPIDLYEHDTNNMSAWGYICECELWEKYEEISKDYKCDFSAIHHTSVEYSKNKDFIFNTKTINDFDLDCTMCVVDITSNNPIDWKIMK